MKRTAALLALLAILAVAGGCAKPAEKPAPPAQNTQNDPPKVDLPKPTTQTYTAKSADDKLEVKVVLAGKVASVELMAKGWAWNSTHAKEEPANDVKNVTGEGHAILTLDQEKPKHHGAMRTSLSELKPGKHSLKVQFVNNDNSPTGTEATVEFEVK